MPCPASRPKYRIRLPDGTVRSVASLSDAIPGADDRAERIVGVFSDVTERKRAEEALRCSQADAERQRRLYEAILANTPDLAYVFDLDHRFIYANQVLLRMWGRGWDEAIGKTCLELGYEPWHAAMHDREIEWVIATKQPIRGEVPFTGTFGRRMYDYIFVPVIGADGRVEAVAGTTRDVTERRQAEEALRVSEARWRGLFESMREGFALCEMVYDAEGRAVDYRHLELNAAWERLTGVPNEAVQGKLVSEVVPGIEPYWIETYARVVETGEPAHFERYLAVYGRWFEVMAYRTEPGRFAVVFLNITERKTAEERQALLAREVEHRAKNALAVVQSVLRLTSAHDPAAYRRAIEGRISALARAQTLLAEDRWRGANLRALLEGELAPFRSDDHCVKLEGPPIALPPGAAQPLAMAAHELATNALKHGALSVPAGRVAVAWDLMGGPAGILRLRWAETGGPPVAGLPARRGFGSRVLEGTVRGQLGGAVSLSWESTGLICEMRVPLGHDQATAGMAGTDTAAAE